MELFGISITLLAGVLTYLSWRNGKWMKQSHQDTMEVLMRIEIGQEETRKEVAEARKEIAEIMANTRKEIADTMAEARKEMAEAIKYLGNLIVSEGEKTRAVL